MNPRATLEYYVTGAIERGEAEPITEIPAKNNLPEWSESTAIAIGQAQVWFESVYSDKGLTKREIRSELLPIAAKIGLSSNAYEYLAKYLTRKLTS